MEGDHKGYRAGSELFVCFTSRQTSVRLGTKSVLSPGRSEKFRESSSSRRLRSNGSKGQSSPMFPSLPYNLTGRKKNGSFETQEPSSPKVTCIGQVRVKSKHNKRFRNGQNSASGRGQEPKSPEREECTQHKSHQKWVHLFGLGKEVSFNICEALRSFGAEFNCFVPCGGTPASSTSPSSKGNKDTTTCGAVFAKWFMVLQDGDEKKSRAAEEEEEEAAIPGVCMETEAGRPSIKDIHRPSIKDLSRRPSIKDLSRLSISDDVTRLEDEEVVSVCPPKNALLLMRCRSEPLRMSPLYNERGYKSEPFTEDEEEHDDTEDESEDEDEDEVYKSEFEAVEEQLTCSSPANKETVEGNGYKKEEEEEEREEEEEEGGGGDDETEKEIWAIMGVANAILEEAEVETETGETVTVEVSETEQSCETGAETETETPAQTFIAEAIPNALLLMMSEPKLSLEISKETWVSRDDFVRRPVVVNMDADDDKENEQSRKLCNNAVETQAGAANSIGRVVEEKVKPRETSIVLTRCKSEPLRASVKLVPEASLWKPRNLEIPSFILRGPLEIGAQQGY